MQSERRRPKQGRSKDKYQTILDVAKDLIGKRGSDAVSVREIAKQAGIAPSSVYQYFPDKNAIILEILRVYFEQTSWIIAQAVNNIQQPQDLEAALSSGIRLLLDTYAKEPDLVVIWASVHANPVLLEQDAVGSEANAVVIARAICNVGDNVDEGEALTCARLLVQIVGFAIRHITRIEDAQARTDSLLELEQLCALRLRQLISQK